MKLIKAVLILLFIAVPLVASAQKAKTIDELAKMYDSSSCKSCHGEIYAQWEKSQHARPLIGIKDGIFLVPVVKASAYKVEDPKKATKANFPCFKCHLPQATDAEDSFYQEVAKAVLDDDKAKIKKLQITCTVCHNEKAIIHKLQDGQPEKDVIYGTKNGSHGDKKYTKMKKSVIMKQAVMCGQCHGLGPNFEFENAFQCATLYGSYLHSYIPSGGEQTCQECHMPKGDHLMAPNWNDRPDASARLKNAISLDIQTLGYQFLPKAGTLIPMVVVNTKVTTKAGHRIPDG